MLAALRAGALNRVNFFAAGYLFFQVLVRSRELGIPDFEMVFILLYFGRPLSYNYCINEPDFYMLQIL
jgi:hypothetical protein